MPETMKKARDGDRVKLHCIGKVEKQSFINARKEKPLEFEIGRGEMIPGIEKAVLGMGIGERKKFRLKPEDSFGQHREELILELYRSQFPEHATVEVGRRFKLKNKEGGMREIRITDIDGDRVTVDGNHPLAGKDLEFEIQMLDIS